ncbi:hypothetical protein C5167_015583 [Papaver somniferum]|uniref:CDC20/Fizzy WD40 domain-containing protein n=1 Tax=Papaver somniferum TaxID=3469 RepID=A0A4Y7JAS2_PAPSO|nr:hypothetical protein C5167_015583 [Papaver somniferum]
MNSREGCSSALRRLDSRNLLQQQILLSRKYTENLDRFIPNRSAIDFDYAKYMLTEGCKGKASTVASSPSNKAYRKQLAEVLNLNRTRILAFKNKPSKPVESLFLEASTEKRRKLTKPHRSIPQIADRILDAPDIYDDYYVNVLDWGSSNVLAIGLGYTVHLWDATESSASELMTAAADTGPITSVSWAPDGHQIAVGLNNSEVQIWDYTSNKLLRTLRGGHQSRVGTMDWNKHILSTGEMDGLIMNNDVRIRNHIVQTYRGHDQEVCGLEWSPSGQQLASGGNDNLIHIWTDQLLLPILLLSGFAGLKITQLQSEPYLAAHPKLTYLLLVEVQMMEVLNSGMPTLELA